MKATPFLLTLSFVSIVLVIATIGSKSYLKASAKSTDAQSTGGALPSFLEKGKTYTFSFAASSGSELHARGSRKGEIQYDMPAVPRQTASIRSRRS